MILAINTTTLHFSLALLEDNGNVRGEFSMTEKQGHFGSLMPALQFLFEQTRTTRRQIGCLAVATGPGSFTGLRVGLSAAKGLCHGIGVPLIGISSLKALASQTAHSHLPVAAVLDSRRDELFTARFKWDETRALVRMTEDASIKLENFPSMFNQNTLFLGNDYARQGHLIKDLLGEKACLSPAHLWNLMASSIGSLALLRYQAQDFDDPHGLDPKYLRPPDIRPNPYDPGKEMTGRDLRSGRFPEAPHGKASCLSPKCHDQARGQGEAG